MIVAWYGPGFEKPLRGARLDKSAALIERDPWAGKSLGGKRLLRPRLRAEQALPRERKPARAEDGHRNDSARSHLLNPIPRPEGEALHAALLSWANPARFGKDYVEDLQQLLRVGAFLRQEQRRLQAQRQNVRLVVRGWRSAKKPAPDLSLTSLTDLSQPSLPAKPVLIREIKVPYSVPPGWAVIFGMQILSVLTVGPLALPVMLEQAGGGLLHWLAAPLRKAKSDLALLENMRQGTGKIPMTPGERQWLARAAEQCHYPPQSEAVYLKDTFDCLKEIQAALEEGRQRYSGVDHLQVGFLTRAFNEPAGAERFHNVSRLFPELNIRNYYEFPEQSLPGDAFPEGDGKTLRKP